MKPGTPGCRTGKRSDAGREGTPLGASLPGSSLRAGSSTSLLAGDVLKGAFSLSRSRGLGPTKPPWCRLLGSCTHKDAGGTCKVSPMAKPRLCTIFSECWILRCVSCVPVRGGGCRCHPKLGTRRPRVLPNTQGPRWAFKITIYYNGAFQAKIPSRGPGVGFWCGRLGVGVDLGFFYFFALNFLFF